MKKAIFTLLVVGLLLSLTTCGPATVDPKTFKGTMTMWSFTDEVKKMIDRFESVYTGVKVELTIDSTRTAQWKERAGRIHG
jgi:ABC-type glycerol-3-phosphate transport system substrate-binding protein